MRRSGEVDRERKSLEEKSFELGGEVVKVRSAEFALRLLRREDILYERVEGGIFRVDGMVGKFSQEDP